MKPLIKKRRETVLRTLYSSEKGLIVHSGAVCEKGLAYVFGGLSDAGKSTLTSKLGEMMIPINDDMNILEFKGLNIEVFTYFVRSEDQGYHYLINENAKGILKAFFFPVKEFEKESHIELLKDKSYIWKMLLTCVAPPLKGEDGFFPNYMAMIDRLIDSVPFYNIHHNLKNSPYEIAELLRSIK